MDRDQQRFERFAQLRAAHPNEDFEDIMVRIHDEEIEADEAAEGRRILEAEENRECRCGRIMSKREASEQRACNDCARGA